MDRVESQKMGKKRLFDIQFSVGEPEGYRAAIWRAWAPSKGDSVYCASVGASAAMKVSFHGKKYAQVAFNDEYFKVMLEQGIDMGAKRQFDHWEPMPNHPSGMALPFRIITLASELRPLEKPNTNGAFSWHPVPSHGYFGEYTFIFDYTDRNVEFSLDQQNLGATVVVIAKLNYGQFWIIYTIQPMVDWISNTVVQSMARTTSANKVVLSTSPLGNLNTRRAWAGGVCADNSRYVFDLAGDHRAFQVF